MLKRSKVAEALLHDEPAAMGHDDAYGIIVTRRPDPALTASRLEYVVDLIDELRAMALVAKCERLAGLLAQSATEARVQLARRRR